jgi:hypothetical protein
MKWEVVGAPGFEPGRGLDELFVIIHRFTYGLPVTFPQPVWSISYNPVSIRDGVRHMFRGQVGDAHWAM